MAVERASGQTFSSVLLSHIRSAGPAAIDNKHSLFPERGNLQLDKGFVCFTFISDKCCCLEESCQSGPCSTSTHSH
jgi:hypothetical protein